MTTTTIADEPGISLDDLKTKLPAPDAAACTAMESAAPREDFVGLGGQIVSARVLTDLARIHGRAFEFWTAASEAQRAVLVGFSLELLSVAVHFALRLRDADAATSAGVGSGAGDKKVREKALAQAVTRGIVLRDQALTAAIGVCGRDDAQRLAVRAAAGNADTYVSLAQGLTGLAGIIRGQLKSTDDGIKARVRLARLSEAYAAALDAAAADITAKGHSASAPRSGTTSQGDLDWLDGLNLHVLSEIIRAFDAAHDIDPTIPRLVPIATRRLLGKRRAKVTPAPTPVPVPVPG